jgi:riboflavin kinase
VVHRKLGILHIKGNVFSGRGEGAKFMQLPWVEKQLKEKLGFVPYAGTLNIRLTKDSNVKKLSKEGNWTEITPPDGFCRGRFVEACFMNILECGIVLPEIENYPKNVVEVIAAVNLREKFRLKDGDTVEVGIILS